MRLVDHHQEVGREVVEEAGGTLALAAAGEVPGVVLDPGTGAHLQHHLDVEAGARLQPLSLEQLARGAKLGQPLRQLGANGAHGALDGGALGDEVLGGVDDRAVERGDGIAGERMNL